MAESLYVHIPFCSSICGYCDFVKLLYRDEWAFAYVDALLDELEKKYAHQSFSTIYIGGGTPNCMPLLLLEKVLIALEKKAKEGCEFTIECNPEFVNMDLAKTLKKHRINRVSMGMETADSILLEKMGRHHDFSDVKKAVRIFKEIGIDNISIDIIYALPNQNEDQFKKDIDAALSLNVPHLSAYTYIQEDHSIWTRQGIKEVSQDIQGDYFEIIHETLTKAGYEHYEISSFCKKKHKSRHNLAYWKDEEYGAIGLGASGYEGNLRYKNTPSLSVYLNNRNARIEETVSKEDDIHYFLMTNLRLKEGFEFARFEKRFGFLIQDKKKEEIKKLIDLGLLEDDKNRLSPTYKGMRLLDSVLLELF